MHTKSFADTTHPMDFSPQQQLAVDAVKAWLEDPVSQVFRLFGYAGTGKTTLAKYLVADVSPVHFAAYTGKAALVLRSKGCVPASTIHSLIYLPKEKSAARLRHLEREAETEQDADRKRELRKLAERERENLRQPAFTLNLESVIKDAALVVLDEVSMVDETMAGHLMSFGMPILALGDPAQLPPVKGTGWFTDAKPDIMLTEIHRQAKGNPIIELATLIREGRVPDHGVYGDSRVVPLGKTEPAELATFDQVLVGLNKTRDKVNRAIRKVRGFTEHLPQPGDKLVCKRNDRETGLLNGSQWTVVGRQDIDEDQMILSIAAYGEENAYTFDVIAWKHPFEDRWDKLDHYLIREAQRFEYGYALTVHSAQGSQWENVCLIDEAAAFPWDKPQKQQWRYTGVTRAANRLTMIR